MNYLQQEGLTAVNHCWHIPLENIYSSLLFPHRQALRNGSPFCTCFAILNIYTHSRLIVCVGPDRVSLRHGYLLCLWPFPQAAVCLSFQTALCGYRALARPQLFKAMQLCNKWKPWCFEHTHTTKPWQGCFSSGVELDPLKAELFLESGEEK